ncbi:MAG TPA: OmpA family protein [Cyclobacteriaceae bacterium]|nr:OmpA family protein [Cyclobacteriaceae bacterium]
MRKVVYAVVIVSMLGLAGCTLPQMIKMAKDQNLTVTPNPLEVHKDTVAYEMAASLPVKMLKKGTVYTVNSFYKYGDKEMSLPAIAFKGDDYPNSAVEQPKVSQKFNFAYQPALKVGTLQIEGVASKGTKSKKTPRMDVAVGLITTSKLVQNSYYAAFADHGYNNKEELIPVVIPDFLFEQGKSVLRKSETSGDKAKQLDAYIAAKNVTRTVTITGTHSPEGRERINSKLSEERAAAIEKYYRAQMKKYDYKGMADSIKFILKPVVDSWNEFKTALASYDGITADEKTEYLNIANNGGNFVDQSKQMEKLKSYKKVFKGLYPSLRSAKTEILTTKKKKTDAEISVLAKQITQGASADGLSFEELMYGATLTPSLEEKAAIYTAATKKGSYWNAHNNLGAVYVQMAIENPSRAAEFADKAAAQLDIAAKIRETPEVSANLATVALMKGNPYKAGSYARKALNGASNDVARGVNGVKGASEIYTAKYDDAVRSTSSATATDINLFNKGLAQLLSKDYANAANSFNDATSKNSNLAIGYYGAAVAAARSGNADKVVSSLTSAVKIDPSLKDKALTDLEFSKWATTDAFRNALK